jgi:polyhydroxybutyrate depolymerase
MQCTSGADVQYYIITGGGHTWPGGLQYLPEAVVGRTSRDINASELLWQFFSAHKLSTL